MYKRAFTLYNLVATKTCLKHTQKNVVSKPSKGKKTLVCN